MQVQQLRQSCLPFDKKILKACAVLEIVNQSKFVEEFLLENYDQLNDDCKSIYLALVNRYNEKIPVGNYGGLYEALDFLYHDHFRIEKKFVLGKQLQSRPRADNTSSKVWSTKILLGYSDASFKLGNYFVNLADDVRKAWLKNKINKKFLSKKDENIRRVMEYYWNGKKFPVDNSEIAVFKAVIDEKSTNKLVLENPTWKSHETDRTESIFTTLKEYHARKTITTQDPRIAMSIVLKGKLEKQDVELQNPVCLTKIFPRFWECLN